MTTLDDCLASLYTYTCRNTYYTYMHISPSLALSMYMHIHPISRSQMIMMTYVTPDHHIRQSSAMIISRSLLNSRRPGPWRVWIWGLVVQFLTPLPQATRATQATRANSGRLDFVRRRDTNDTIARKVTLGSKIQHPRIPRMATGSPKGTPKGGKGGQRQPKGHPVKGKHIRT